MRPEILANSRAKDSKKLPEMCCTTSSGGKSRGRQRSNCESAMVPPVLAPITMHSKSFTASALLKGRCCNPIGAGPSVVVCVAVGANVGAGLGVAVGTVVVVVVGVVASAIVVSGMDVALAKT